MSTLKCNVLLFALGTAGLKKTSVFTIFHLQDKASPTAQVELDEF